MSNDLAVHAHMKPPVMALLPTQLQNGIGLAGSSDKTLPWRSQYRGP